MNIDTAIVTIVTCITFCTELKPIESPLLQIDSSMTVSIILGTEPTQRMDSYHRTNQLVTARHFLTPQSMEFLKGHRYFLKATITTFSLFTFKSHHSGLFPQVSMSNLMTSNSSTVWSRMRGMRPGSIVMPSTHWHCAHYIAIARTGDTGTLPPSNWGPLSRTSMWILYKVYILLTFEYLQGDCINCYKNIC